MATLAVHEAEPLRKRIKLSPEAELAPLNSPPSAQNQDDPENGAPDIEMADSSFTFSPSPLPNRPSDPALDYILDINKYIPVGSLRIQRSDCAISSEVWKSCSTWHAFAHPRDVYNSRGGPYLLNKIQELLLNSPVLQPYRTMHNAGWIRMEFKMKDQHHGQVRVYMLPDDVGRASIGRQQSSLRKAMQLLIAQIDISQATWSGDWSENTPVAHIDSSLDEKPKEDVSLFYLFNTLPSPKPDPEAVVDRYAREAMYRILDSDIEGLTTKMHLYQRRSAALMLQREAQPAQIIDPRLRPIVDQKGATWYCNLDAGSCLREPRTYESAKGGICAETMGLGKTLICLALILATRELSSQIPVEYSVVDPPEEEKKKHKTNSLMTMAAVTLGRTGTPWKSHFAAMEADGYDYSQCLKVIGENAGHFWLPNPPPRREQRNPVSSPQPRKIWLTTATIVVVPPNLVQQWRHEIKKHTFGLKVLVMNSNKAELPPAKELAEFDLILFSKPRFDKEAKDGSDNQGRRRTTTNSVCSCPYIGSTRTRDCTCFKEEDAYRSPLRDLQFKRLITDEGHTFGNASSSSRTEAVTVVDFLQLCSRWIVSGTPTQGLYGAEIGLSNSGGSSMSNTPLPSESDENLTGAVSDRVLELPDSSDTSSETPSEQEKAFYKQERKDLEKLGNIATMYLKARPWSNTYEEGDLASWAQHVMQPRHGSKSHGNMECLKSALEGMIIRHKPEDVSQDVVLPPLHQTIVYLDGSMQDRLSLNMFAMMIVSNAVTSERKDNDYFFHPRQRKSLQLLVTNMRQASFFWSNFTTDHVQGTIDVARTFLKKGEVPVTLEDEALLWNAIEVGEMFIANNISKAARQLHEMPLYIQNECPEDVRAAWALDEDPRNPTLMGAGMVVTAQDSVQKQLWRENPMDGLVDAGKKALHDAYLAQEPAPSSHPTKPSTKDPKRTKKAIEQAQVALAGGVSVGDTSTPKKRPRTSSISAVDINLTSKSKYTTGVLPSGERTEIKDVEGSIEKKASTNKPKSALKKSKKEDIVGTLDSTSPLASAAIVSTSSAKLSYLMDRIITHHTTDKILVFYEADNIAYYIAQALECLHIKHLIYAKSLSSDRRSKYVVTFNQSEDFRVLLMDVSQAAFGLDLSSASRVYFVNPVFSPQVEAQAVKRAHRIGQTKPVFVETLILKGSIEEVILERRKDMSTEEHNKCKSILDDQTMYDWIRNVRFLPLPVDEVPGPDQMAKLEIPQLVFGRGAARIGKHDPDAGLIADDLSPDAKGKKRKKAAFADDEPASNKAKGKRKLTFAIPEADGYISTDDEGEQDQEEINRQKKRESTSGTGRSPNRKCVSFLGTSGMFDDVAGPVRLYDPFRGSLPHDSDVDDETDENSQFPPLDQDQGQSIWDSAAQANAGWGFAPFTKVPSGYGPANQSRYDPSITSLPFSQPHLGLRHLVLPPLPESSSFNQPTHLNPFTDSDAIEYSTPRPRVKRLQTQVLGIKMPNGGFNLPPRNYTSLRAASESPSPSPTSTEPSSPGSGLGMGGVGGFDGKTKAERARLCRRSLLVKLKLGRSSSKMGEIEKKSDDWRAEMRANGAKLGERGWERKKASSGRPVNLNMTFEGLEREKGAARTAEIEEERKERNKKLNRKRDRDEDGDDEGVGFEE